jgi:hypothetical protein
MREYRETEREITQINDEEETNGHMKANICRDSTANEMGISHQRIHLIDSLITCKLADHAVQRKYILLTRFRKRN